jgi:phosphatidylserine/phosphatidylglycerophosphate/cardiolipin synthase-like enzyme
MALQDISTLARFKATPFPPGYPIDSHITFFAPYDNLHQVLLSCIRSAQKSLIVGMYGLDDDELVEGITKKQKDENVYTQWTLDSSQAGGVHEKRILEMAALPSNSVAIGRSPKGAIVHVKMLIVDGLDVISGSTNWSDGGENKQANQLTVTRHPLVAAEARNYLDLLHEAILTGVGQPKKKPVS